MNRILIVVVLATLFMGTNAEAQLRLHGSNTVGEELAPALIEAWLTAQGFERIETTELATLESRLTGTNGQGRSISVEIHAHGSSTSFRDLGEGSADIGMSSRRIRPGEVEQLAFLGQLDQARHEFVIGIDGLAVIVHPSNPVQALSVSQIRDVFSGAIDNWRELGGPDARIQRYARDEKSGTWDSFSSMVLQGSALARSERFESSSELSERVAADPAGIGFIGLPYVRNARALKVSAGGAAVAPERFSSATEDYPLSRRLYLYVPERQIAGLGGSLAQFAVSATGQRIVDDIGFVGQAIELERVAVPSAAPGEYRGFIEGAWRASLNFRFDRGQATLDSKSQRDLDRLIDFMAQSASRRYEVLLMGFADPSETSSYFSMALSSDRVDYVATLLGNAGVRVRRARGFGDALPLAEGTGPGSQAKNRRVEVWLRERPATFASGRPASSP